MRAALESESGVWSVTVLSVECDRDVTERWGAGCGDVAKSGARCEWGQSAYLA